MFDVQKSLDVQVCLDVQTFVERPTNVLTSKFVSGHPKEFLCAQKFVFGCPEFFFDVQNITVIFYTYWQPKNYLILFFLAFWNLLTNFCSFRSFVFFSWNSLRRCDVFGPKIINIRAILVIFRPFEDFQFSAASISIAISKDYRP